MALSKLKQFATNPIILSSIQLASVIAASKIDKKNASNGAIILTNRILNTPEDMEWLKSISYYVICNNTDTDWENFQDKQEDIESNLVDLCFKAIEQIGA